MRPAWMSRFGGGQFGERADDVHGAGAAGFGVGPWHATVDGEVDLERAWAAAEPPVSLTDAARQTVAEDACDRLGRHVEHGHVGRRKL
jgi:hypothetical protein